MDSTLQINFLKAVESLNLRFPVAKISKETGYKSAIVSEYLNSKKEVSERFARKFCEVYGFKFEDLTKSNTEIAKSAGAENINHMVRSTDENIALLKGLEDVHEGESLRRYFKGQGKVISKLDTVLGISYQQINNYLQMEEIPEHFKLLLKDKMQIDFKRDVLQGGPSVSLQQMKMPELFDGVYKYLAEIQKRIS